MKTQRFDLPQHPPHRRWCQLRIAAEGAAAIACDHGYDVCPKCDRCTCEPAQKKRVERRRWKVTPYETGLDVAFSCKCRGPAGQYPCQPCMREGMKAAVAAAVLAEREACADLAEAHDSQWLGNRLTDSLIQRGLEIAAAIRGRGGG